MSKEIVLLGCSHPGHRMVSAVATVGRDGSETYGKVNVTCKRDHAGAGPVRREVLARGQPGRIVFGIVLVGCRCDEDQGFEGRVTFQRRAKIEVTEVSDCCPTCCETLKPWSFRPDVCFTEGCNNVIDDSCYTDDTCDRCHSIMQRAERQEKRLRGVDDGLADVWSQIAQGDFRIYPPGHNERENFGPLGGWTPRGRSGGLEQLPLWVLLEPP